MNLNKLLHDPEDFGIFVYNWQFGRLNVYQSVDLSNKNLKDLPFLFGEVSGDFSIANNELGDDQISKLPLKCRSLDLSMNQFKTLKGFRTNCESIVLMLLKLDSLEYLSKFRFNHFMVFQSCVNDWSFPIEANEFFLASSDVKDLSFIKNKSLNHLDIMFTNVNDLSGIDTNSLFISVDKNQKNPISLKGLLKKPDHFKISAEDSIKELYWKELERLFKKEGE